MESEPPLMTLKGNNHWRVISIILLLIISISSFLLIQSLSFAITILGIYCLFMTVFIRFPRIEIRQNKFDFIKKSLIKKFNRKETYEYKDLKSIEFSKGHYNWSKFLFLSITNGKSNYMGSDGQNAKSDSMKIVKLNNVKIEISRIGSKKNFKEAINLINKLIE